jgi:folate-binding protein YgfZ
VTAVVAATGPDAGLAWHLGDPLGEQRRLAGGGGVVDLSNRDVVTLAGPDRLRYLDLMTTQRFGGLAAGAATAAFFLDAQGHILCHFHAVVGDPVFGWTEPGQGKELADRLERGKFRLAVTVEHRPDVALLWTRGGDVAGSLDVGSGVGVAGPLDVRAGVGVAETLAHGAGRASRVVDVAGPLAEGVGVDSRGVDVAGALAHRAGADSRVVGVAGTLAVRSGVDLAGALAVRSGVDSLGGSEVFWPRARLAEVTPTAGTWAYEALRVAAGLPRVGVDTDHRTLPNELGVPSPALVLDKGCYPGQETVARVHNLGHLPRRLARVHLDGSAETLPEPGTPLVDPHGQEVGRLGAAAYHWELGPIALALVQRGADDRTPLTAAGVPAALERLVDPDQGLHFAAPRRLGRPAQK